MARKDRGMLRNAALSYARDRIDAKQWRSSRQPMRERAPAASRVTTVLSAWPSLRPTKIWFAAAIDQEQHAPASCASPARPARRPRRGELGSCWRPATIDIAARAGPLGGRVRRLDIDDHHALDVIVPICNAGVSSLSGGEARRPATESADCARSSAVRRVGRLALSELRCSLLSCRADGHRMRHAAAIAPDLSSTGLLAGSPATMRGRSRICVDLVAVEGQDDVALLEPRLGRPGSFGTTSATSAPFGSSRPSAGGDLRRHLLDLHAEPAALDRAVLAQAASITGLARLDGMAKPMPTLPPLGEEIAVLMPITWPSRLKVGPPELPWLIGASIWRKSSKGPEWMSRLRAETMPARHRAAEAERDCRPPCTQSPTRAASESPEVDGGQRLSASILSSARSVLRVGADQLGGDTRLPSVQRHLDVAGLVDRRGCW